MKRPLFLCAVLAAGAMPALAQTTSLTLEGAMTRAREATAGARALASAIDETEARIQRARSGFWPRVDVTETAQRGNQPVFVFGTLLAQRRFSATDFALPALNHPDPVTNTRTALALEQPVFDAGVTARGIEAAQVERDLAIAAKDAGRQDLAFRAAEAFVRVLQLQAAVLATEAAVRSAESDRERASARRDVGLATEGDVLAVDVHLADMRQRQIAAGGDLTVARIELAEAVGLPLTDSITVIRPTSRPGPDVGASLVREAVAAHPEHRQATAGFNLADNAWRSARSAVLPSIGVQAGWEFNGKTLGTQQASWVVGAEVRLNLFRGFGDSARIAEMRHALARAGAEREQVARRIEVEVRSALTQLSTARAREEAGRAALSHARESQRIIRDRYESGLATVTDVLRAAEAMLDAESRATGAELDVVLRTVALDRALGRL